MARTVLDYDEDLPPVELDFVPIDLRELAAAHPAGHYLFPCRCAGLELDAQVDFLDAGPPRGRRLDARRLRALAPDPRRAVRPRAARAGRLLPAASSTASRTTEPTLLKCCLRERGIEREGARLTVPWGASLEEVREALRRSAGGGGMTSPTRSSTATCGAPTETRALFDDEGRTRDLAARSSPRSPPRRRELGIIPAAAAERDRRRCEQPSTSRRSARRRARPATRRSG